MRIFFSMNSMTDRRRLLILTLCLFANTKSSELAGAVKGKPNLSSTTPAASAKTPAVTLPDQYFRLLEAGADRIERHLAAQPTADLPTLESRDESWRLLSHAALVGAVLYAKRDPANRSYRRPQMLALAIKIGDLLASETEQGRFESRLNSDRDLYVWLEGLPIVGSQTRGRAWTSLAARVRKKRLSGRSLSNLRWID